jgi:hypothetical protein
MPDDTRCANGLVVGDLLSVATLLKNPQLTGLYAYLYREEPATVREVMNALDFSRETTQTLLSRLEEMGTVETLTDDEPQKYRAASIELSLSADQGDRTYTVTPALIDAVGRRTADGDIDTYIDRHGLAGLATALIYAVDRERSRVTHRLMARDLDIAPLEAEIILQALRPVVHDHFEIEVADSGDVFESESNAP